MTGWLSNNWVEVTGAIFALIYLAMEIKQQWPMWVVGIISSLFYVYIFFHAKLYAEMGLNGYYVFMSCYGLYCWKYKKTPDNKSIGITRITPKLGIILGITTVCLTALLSSVLLHYTDSPVPYLDAIIAALSIVTTWMAARKIIEHWIVWIFINYFSVSLYLYLKLYPTAILFFIYGTLSIVGWMSWKKTWKQ